MKKEPSNAKRKWTAEEVAQWYREHSAITYINKADANIVVRKRNGMGRTVNWANPKAYLLQGAILAIVLALIFLL